MDNKYYVYVLLDDRYPGKYICPGFGDLGFKPFYVGKGLKNYKSKQRHLWHYATYNVQQVFEKNPHKCRTIKILLEDLSNQPNYKIVFETDDEQEAFNCEIALIKLYGRSLIGGILTNITPGGEGGNTIDTVPGLKEKLIKIASERWSGAGNPKYGVPLEQNHSHLSKLSGNHWNEGNKYDWSKETRQKVKENRRKYIHKVVRVDPSTRQDLEILLSVDMIEKYALNKTALNRSLKYGGKHAGFLWRYEDEELKLSKTMVEGYMTPKRPHKQKDNA
jgi:hypothetical protein